MIFQILDNKEECFGIYKNGDFIYDRLPADITGTWNYNSNLRGHNINFAHIYAGGRSMDEVCPDDLKLRLQKREGRIKAFINSAVNAKINVGNQCMFDLVPEQHLKHYCEIKNQICQWVFNNYDKPDNHQFVVDLYEMASDIQKNPVLIDHNVLKKASKSDMKARALVNFLNGQNKPICYDVWGSVTGRLTTRQGSFPIMNLKKELANCVIPKNDIFVQFDLNGAEIRTLLSLSTATHPREDVHEYNIKNVYRGIGTRDKAKKRFFAWLYNPNAEDYLTERFYNKTKVLKKYYRDGIVATPFGRKIPTDDFHALNYLLQSTSSDNCMMQCTKINKFLMNNKSFVHSVVHDSLTIDLSLNDRHLLPQIQEIFEDTQLGWFKSSVHVGSNLRDLMEVSWS
jgi:hypothetical protein